MLKKRIIPCLDVRNGRTVKGVNFLGIRDAGDPVELAARYASDGADELVFLDITATDEKRKTITSLVQKIAREINIPFSVGGGIGTLEDAQSVINAGADKVTINSAAFRNPDLIQQITGEFGSQCVVAAIDARLVDTDWIVFVNGGNVSTGVSIGSWAKQVEQLGAGEILLTSIDMDGTKSGYAIDLLAQVCSIVNIPVIASGGAGNREHFKEVFSSTKVSGALAASIFHFGEVSLPSLKQYLKSENILVR